MKRLLVLNLVVVTSLIMGSAVFAADDITNAANNYFSRGIKDVTADVLYGNLNDGDASNDPYIVDVRSKEDHDKGHIPGDHWVDPKGFFQQETLDNLPTEQQLVVYCYTGETAGQIVSVLNMMGYDAHNLLYGFGAWTMKSNAGSKWFDPAKDGHDYPIETKINEAKIYDLPLPTPLADTIRAAAGIYFSESPKNIGVEELYDNISDGDDTDDPFVLSVRSPEDYAKGHIPGAVNITPDELFTEENLVKLPPNKQIIVYCYNGQTASQVTSALRLLGFDAYNLLYGMQAWTTDDNVRVKYFDPQKYSFDYAFEGTAAEGAAEQPTPQATPETTPTVTPVVATPQATPETPPEPILPVTGGRAFPIQSVLIVAGVVVVAAGLYLNRRESMR